MMPRTAAQAFADATSALTQEHDVTDVLARLVRACAELLSAEAIGVLVLGEQGALELLSSTSHRVAELETFQIQHADGPCIEAIRTEAALEVAGSDALRERWPVVGAAIVEAGYLAVQAFPMRWHGHTLGAMNVFHATPEPATADGRALGQAFADIATIVLIQTTDVSLQQVTANVQEALSARTTIERAKGVLAYRRGVDMATAYDLLVAMVGAESTITATAVQVIATAQRPSRPQPSKP